MTLQEVEERLSYLVNSLDRNKEIVGDINKALYFRSEPTSGDMNKAQTETTTEDGYIYRITNLLNIAGKIVDNEWGILNAIQNKLRDESVQEVCGARPTN